MDTVFNVFYYIVFILAVVFVVLKYVKTNETDLTEKKPVKLSARTVLIIMAIAFGSRLFLWLFSFGITHAFGLGRDLLDTWHHWDAQQYYRIAEVGYYDVNEGWIRLVFYPLYPSVMWVFNLVFRDARISGLLVSWLSLSAACVYLYKLVMLDWDKATAKRAVKYLLIFPVTVFLGAGFTESLFLMLSFACFYYSRIRRFGLAALMGFLAALTRNVGVLLVFPVFAEMLYAHSFVPKLIKDDTKSKLIGLLKDFRYVLAIPLGTIVYLLINHFITGDALAFLKIQQDHWSQSFGSYANTLSVTFGQIMNPDNILRNKLTLWISQLAVLIIGGATLPVIAKKMRLSYGVYALAYLFIIFTPTWLLSGFRYYMALAVLYPALALLTKRRWADITLTTVSALLMPIYTFCFSVQWQVI